LLKPESPALTSDIQKTVVFSPFPLTIALKQEADVLFALEIRTGTFAFGFSGADFYWLI
jgi:hypothetical protein